LQLFVVDNPSIILDTIKLAEDGNGLVIRMAEVSGCHSQAELRWKGSFAQVEKCDLLERPVEPCEPDGQKLQLAFRPFEVMSLRFQIGHIKDT
jgi:alpha-mannosidase